MFPALRPHCSIRIQYPETLARLQARGGANYNKRLMPSNCSLSISAAPSTAASSDTIREVFHPGSSTVKRSSPYLSARAATVLFLLGSLLIIGICQIERVPIADGPSGGNLARRAPNENRSLSAYGCAASASAPYTTISSPSFAGTIWNVPPSGGKT